MIISEIAKLAGVGKATVSRVINRSGAVKEETRQRVEAVIKEYGYTPSATARNLSRQESDTIALIVPEFSNSFFTEIISGISAVVEQNGLTMLLYNTENSAGRDIRILEAIRSQRVKGILYTPAAGYDAPNCQEGPYAMQIIKELDTPIVLIDRMIDGVGLDGVFSDNIQGAYIATKALIEAGHREIGIVLGDLNLHNGRDRFEGYCRAMRDHNLKIREEYQVFGEFDTETTYTLTQKLLKEGMLPDAFFVCNNLSGKGLLKAVFERGLRIPEDLGYICFDAVDSLDLFGMELSCLDRNVEQMGRCAIELLLNRIARPEEPPKELVLMPKLRLAGSEKKAGSGFRASASNNTKTYRNEYGGM